MTVQDQTFFGSQTPPKICLQWVKTLLETKKGVDTFHASFAKLFTPWTDVYLDLNHRCMVSTHNLYPGSEETCLAVHTGRSPEQPFIIIIIIIVVVSLRILQCNPRPFLLVIYLNGLPCALDITTFLIGVVVKPVAPRSDLQHLEKLLDAVRL